MTSSDEAKPKRARKRTGTLSKQRTLRFGAAEEAAIEAVRAALSKTRGTAVGFSEAHRMLLLDKEEAARVEARAAAMTRLCWLCSALAAVMTMPLILRNSHRNQQMPLPR